MKIKSIHIKNFRSLKDVIIPFDSVTTFIGPNGAGKSTVLRALDWFFNGKPNLLTEKDCSFEAINEDIEVRVTFSDLSVSDRNELGKYTPDGVTTFTAWKCRNPDGTETLSANSKSYIQFNTIRSKGSAADKKAAYNELRNSDPALNLPAWSNVEAANQAMTLWETDHTDKLTEAPDSLQTNFFGFNSSGKMSGLFDFVLVTADLRANEESIDGKSSIIGRILERSVDRTSADEEIAKIVEESRDKQQKIYEEKFKVQLETMTAKLNEIVTSYSPGRFVEVSPVEIEIKAPRTTFEVAVMDGVNETVVERQGHGFQRTLLISALQLLAQSGTASAEGVICLAIEEPELFQHPIQAQNFAKVLRSLAEATNKRIQITYATHSPYFIEARHFDQVRRLTRSAEKNPIVTIHSATIADLKALLEGTVNHEQVDRHLDGIVTERLAAALFADRTLLVEGDTDAAILYGIGDRDAMGCFESQGLAIVSAGGKGGIPLTHAILICLGIPTYTLFDRDIGFEARARTKGKPEKTIAAGVAQISKENNGILRYLGETEIDPSLDHIGNYAATFADNLESYIESNWPEWRESYSEIEKAAGFNLGKNQFAYRTATLAAKRDPPEMFNKILMKARGV